MCQRARLRAIAAATPGGRLRVIHVDPSMVALGPLMLPKRRHIAVL